MATKHTSRDGLRKKLAALAISATLFAACGSTSQAPADPRDNEQRAAVVRDPSNPYWVGSAEYDRNLASSMQSGDRPSIIHDPENPYWWMSNAPTDDYADPVHGDH
jgi:ABC-type glycerol-3-phosphate transport system substrate-binding protein